MSTTFTRSFPLEDITIQAGGDGRTVEAYAAVFNTPTTIRDQDGHYTEVIDAGAFTKTISERGSRFGVFFNHGLTLHGTPSERHSMPIGTPQEVRVESRGVLTVTRYNKTPLADEVLEAINSGAITGQSFSGRMLQSKTDARRPYRERNGVLPTVTRTEIAMTEYGPTPLPAYEDAGILGVRSLLGAYRDGDIDLARLAYLSQDLSLDGDELRQGLAEILRSTTDDGRSESTPDTSPAEAVTAEPTPEAGHSGPVMSRAQAQAHLLKMGILL